MKKDEIGIVFARRFLGGKVFRMTLTKQRYCRSKNCGGRQLPKGHEAVVVVIGKRGKDAEYIFFCSDDCKNQFEDNLVDLLPE